MVRTTKVSINTPTETANPSCERNTISPAIIPANVPARMTPAEVMIDPALSIWDMAALPAILVTLTGGRAAPASEE